jgi:hypothetical protein
MPDIITAPGHYIARNGETVIIESIALKGSTPCRGKVSRTKESGKQHWVWTLWGRNGRQFAGRPHNEDVMSAV